MPFTNEVPQWDPFLAEFEARQSADDLKLDLELTHMPCGEVLADIENGDELGILVSLARTRICGPPDEDDR